MILENGVTPLTPEKEKIVTSCKATLVTAPVTNTPKIIKQEITKRTSGYGRTLAKFRRESDIVKIILEADTYRSLVIIDEEDRLNINSLEEVRSLYDQYQFGLILIGMPGIEKRFYRYPQLFSRIGFSHEFKRLSEDEMRFIFPKIGDSLSLTYNPDYYADVEALNTIMRNTAGNFRLIDRLFSQISRIVKINNMQAINKEVVDAARTCLIIN